MDEFERREHVISLLMTQSESRLEAFFFSLGLAADFQGPAPGWGRQKRIVSALMASEQRGDLPSVLALVERKFDPTSSESQHPVHNFDSDTGHSAETAIVEQRPSADPERTGRSTIADSVTSVFIVHGHNMLLREQVARFVERIGVGRLEPLVLSEQTNQGDTIIEKFEKYAMAAGFAIILLTPDDAGHRAGESSARFRARQNVILELGYFAGILGRPRVAVLLMGEIELPSDLGGFAYITVDDAGAWKHHLAREMGDAGLPVDFSKIILWILFAPSRWRRHSDWVTQGALRRGLIFRRQVTRDGLSLQLYVEARVLEFAEEFCFPGAIIVEGDIRDAIHVRGFLDAGAYKDADFAAANESVEVTHFEDYVLSAAWLGLGLTCEATMVVWGENDDGVGDFGCVLFELLDQGLAEVGLVAKDDCFPPGRSTDGVRDRLSAVGVPAVNDEDRGVE